MTRSFFTTHLTNRLRESSPLVLCAFAIGACHRSGPPPSDASLADYVEVATFDVAPDANDVSTVAGGPTLPLQLVMDVGLPGGATRWDYQEIDAARGHLAIAHMGDSTVVVVSLADGSLVGQVPNVGTVRGIAVADSVGKIFATAASTNQLVIIDAQTVTEIGRATTGRAPDGVAWDGTDQIVGVSDQSDGAISLIANAGTGAHTKVPLGVETGNVVYDASRGRFWITVVRTAAPDQVVAVDPTSGSVLQRIDLPGCSGAHGLRIHPDGQSVVIACEDNAVLVRVDLASASVTATAPAGTGPDVLSIDTNLGWLYVAAESGNLTVFDINRPGLVNIDDEHPDATAHSVAADPATHRVYFPLVRGPNGTPVLRIMRPGGV